MRTRFLSQLAVNGRDKVLALEPELDLYRADQVVKLEIEFDEATEQPPTLRLALACEARARRYRLSLLFEGVRELTLPTMAPRLHLPELEIEDVSAQGLEGIRFEAVSHFERAFLCACQSISVLSLEPL